MNSCLQLPQLELVSKIYFSQHHPPTTIHSQSEIDRFYLHQLMVLFFKDIFVSTAQKDLAPPNHMIFITVVCSMCRCRVAANPGLSDWEHTFKEGGGALHFPPSERFSEKYFPKICIYVDERLIFHKHFQTESTHLRKVPERCISAPSIDFQRTSLPINVFTFDPQNQRLICQKHV